MLTEYGIDPTQCFLTTSRGSMKFFSSIAIDYLNRLKNARVLLRFEFHVPHQILYATFATDNDISHRNLEFSKQKNETFLEN